jgi:hypothetical protein
MKKSGGGIIDSNRVKGQNLVLKNHPDCVGRDRGENSLGYNVGMNRPRGLLLTAWIMVVLMVAGWVRAYFWPHHANLAHPSAHLHDFITVFHLIITIAAFVCIFYYARGGKWARIAVETR